MRYPPDNRTPRSGARLASGRKAAERRRELEQLFLEVIPPERRRAILEQITLSAAQGDLRAAAFLFDRIYGKPVGLPNHDESSEANEAEIRAPDLSRLTDHEVETLACLLRKAEDLEQPSLEFDYSQPGDDPEALSP
jgi:hypothetical protein